MSKLLFNYLFLILCVFKGQYVVCSEETTPVVIWNNYRAFNDQPVVPALSIVSSDDFVTSLNSVLHEDSFLVAFTEAKLSTEDLRCRVKGKLSLDNVNKQQDKNQFVYYPNVENVIEALMEFSKTENVANNVLTRSGLKSSESEDSNILFVKFDDYNEGEDMCETLQRHDEFMMTEYNKLVQKHKNVIAIYTANEASVTLPDLVRLVRDTKEEDEKDNQFHNVTEVYLFMEALVMLSGPDLTVEELITIVSSELKNASENSLTMELESDKNHILSFTFEHGGGYWSATEITFMKSEGSASVSLRPSQSIYGLDGFSFHCSPNITLIGTDFSLLLLGLQVEPFLGQNPPESFSEALDCVGFMSAPILAGLFVTLILASIISLGICMMMDLKTMDRFEDPKGKTITISATE